MHPATEISTIPWPHGERLRSINRCSAVRNRAFPGTANYVKSFLGLYSRNPPPPPPPPPFFVTLPTSPSNFSGLPKSKEISSGPRLQGPGKPVWEKIRFLPSLTNAAQPRHHNHSIGGGPDKACVAMGSKIDLRES